MHLMIKLLLCLCLPVVSVIAQEKVSKVTIKPFIGGSRVKVEQTGTEKDSYLRRSMIIEFTLTKKDDEDTFSFQYDLTPSVRFLYNKEKKQKMIRIVRSPSEIKLKCSGKWVEQNINPTVSNFLETIKQFTQSINMVPKKSTEVPVTADLEKKITTIFDIATAPTLPCEKNN